jgi:AcrR family transcriptional regulator
MKEKGDARERIVRAASELIAESSGCIESITTRAIAERARVGTGLINYHFQTKENLIELCVQQLIGSFIARFKPTIDPALTGAAKVAGVAKNVADYLAANPAVSRISILGDMKTPGMSDNTMKTVRGMSLSLKDDRLSEQDKTLLTFALTAVIQSIFLRRDLSAVLFKVDFNDKAQRDAFIELIVGRMLGKD